MVLMDEINKRSHHNKTSSENKTEAHNRSYNNKNYMKEAKIKGVKTDK